MNNILIRGGRIFDPGNQLDLYGDLLMENGFVSEILHPEDQRGHQILFRYEYEICSFCW